MDNGASLASILALVDILLITIIRCNCKQERDVVISKKKKKKKEWKTAEF